MSPETIASIAGAYNRYHEQFEGPPVADDPWHLWAQQALDRARDLDGQRVLEAGCGRGALTHWLAAHARPAVLIGTDLSSTALQRAHASAPAGDSTVGWPASDVARLPFADQSFDTVICCETIEHVLDPHAAIRELARVLAPGGRLFLTAPSYLNATGLYRGYLRLTGRHYDEGGQPVAQFTTLPRTLGWVRDAALVVEQVDGRGHYLPFPGRAPIRIAALDATPLRPILKWSALHTAVIARKPASGART
jgi:2-polyprenyl-3-methyl-5-hydroxy-6-metoxy-1,4-benzoquinol methylase